MKTTIRETSAARDVISAIYTMTMVAWLTTLFAVPSVLAANSTWSGAGNSVNLNVSGNWDTLPVSGSGWIFGSANGSQGTTLNNDFSSFNVAGITFNSGSQAWTFGGNSFNLTAALTNNSSGNTITFNNSINPTAAQNWCLASGTTTTFNGSLSDSAAIGTIFLGGTTAAVSGGTVNMNGTTTLNFSGGTFRALILRGVGTTLNIGSSASLTIGAGAQASSGYFNVAGDASGASVTLNVANGGSLIVSGTTGTIPTANIGTTAADVATVNIAGTMTYGGVNLSIGAASGTTAVNINNGGILNWNNTARTVTLAASGTVTINSGGTLASARTWSAGTGKLVLAGGTFQATAAQTLVSGLSVSTTSSGSIIDANSFAVSIPNAISGSGGLSIASTVAGGTVTLSGANTYSGNTKVNAGTLAVGNNLALQNSTLDTSGAGAVNVTGFTTPTLGGLVGSVDLASVITTAYGSVTALTLNPGTGVSDSYFGIIANGASGMTLTKSGAGTQILSGANSYTGTTLISAGKLLINGTQTSATGAATVNDGATLGVTATGANQWSPSTLTLGSSSGAAVLEFNNISSTANAPLQPAAVSYTGATARTVNINSGSGLTIGNSYPLLANAGSANLSKFTLGTQPYGVAGTLAMSGNTLVYTVTALTDTWTGSASANWNIGTDANWGGNAANNSPANTYKDGDGVSFADGGANPSITVAAQVNPSSISVNNSSTAYTLTSSGGNYIGGSGSLTKSGTSTLTLAGGNSYSGGTTIGGGVLDVQNSSSMGNSSGNASVSSGAALQVDGSGLSIANALALNGTGVSSGGALRNLANNNNYAGAITLNSATRINSDAGTLTLNSGTAITSAQGLTFGGAGNISVSTPILTGANSVAKDGAGTLTLSGNNSYTGGTTVSAGTLVLSGNNTSATGGVTNSGTLQLQGASALSSSSALALNSGSTLSLLADANTTFTTAAFSGPTSGNYTIAVDYLNAGNTGKTLTLASTATMGAGTTGTLTVSSSSGDTLAFSSVYYLGTGVTTINLSSANMTFAGMNGNNNQAAGITVSSSTGNTLQVNGTWTTSNNRYSLAQVSSGTLILNNTQAGGSGANNGVAAILAGGTLNVQNANAVGGAGLGNNLTLTNGTLDNTSGSAITLLKNPVVTINGDFAFSTTGGTSANNLNLGTGAVGLGSAAGTTRTITANGSAMLTVGGSIANGTTANSLTKAGNAILALGGVNIYTGGTTINSGELIGQTGGSCSNSAVTVVVGATNGVKVAAANGQWTCASLTYTAGGTSYSDFDFNSVSPSTTTAPLNLLNDLANNGTAQVIVRNGTFTAGQIYPLIAWIGNGPTNLISFAKPILLSGGVGTLTLGNKSINLNAGIYAPNLFFTNAPGVARIISVSDLVAAGLASAQSSPIYTVTVGTPVNGGAAFTNASGTLMRYTNSPSFSAGSDSFTYTVSDGTSSASATVSLAMASVTGPALAPSGTDGSGHAVINFNAIPNYTYHMQHASTLGPPPDWTNLLNAITVPSNGAVTWTNLESTAAGFYRLSYP